MKSIHTTPHPAALAAKTWLMYEKGEKQYQTLKPARGSDTPDNSNFANNAKTQKRQQLYSEDFEWLSVKGARRKMFQEVWRVVIG